MSDFYRLPTALPLFRADHPAYALFYAPGYLVVATTDYADTLAQQLGDFTADRHPAATALRRWAAQAQAARAALFTQLFAPVCLTLYLHNACQLQCNYCYADPTPRPAQRLSLPTIRAAARLVMANCRAQGRPFTLVCHGGGEPTLDRPLLARVLAELAQLATAYDLPTFRYVATNGVLSAAAARWLAQQFDLIGLSCDGPPAVQNGQRPLRSGQGSARFVERAAQIIHAAGTPLHVRVTITPQSVTRQAEIAAYLCTTLRPAEIHVEPVYHAGRAAAADCFTPEQADLFVAEFSKAKLAAQGYGVPWRMSGSRAAEIHGPYCHVLRQVLQLTPGGGAVACFKEVQDGAALLQIGRLETVAAEFRIDSGSVHTLRTNLETAVAPCAACFNQYHCAGACPDFCPALETPPAASFRCRVNRQLMMAHLRETAVYLRANCAAAAVAGKVIQ